MNEKYIIPGSIIIAGLIIGAAIFFGGNSNTAPATGNYDDGAYAQAEQPAAVPARIVDPNNDNITGNADAEIFVIEYSDLDCPFCARYHNNALKQLKETYSGDDRVSFVFRHFPLDEPYTQALHPQATEKHIAAQCIAQLGGANAFNSFVGLMFSDEDTSDLSKLPSIAVRFGVDENAFNNCYNDRATEPKVASDFQEGAQAGVQGTPTVFLQTADGNTYQVPADFNAIKIGVDAYLAELK